MAWFANEGVTLKYEAFQFRHYGQGVRIFDYCTILKPEVISLADGVRIDDYTKIEGGQGVTIGTNVHIASFTHINGGGGEINIGAHSGLASGVRVIGGYPDFDYLHISSAEPPELCHVIKKRTVIGEYVAIYSNAIILPGVAIGDGAMVAAGAVVNRDVDPWSIVTGNPAKIVAKREICRW